LKAAYDGNGVASPEQIAAALARTTLTTSLSDALVDADLLIEAIPERLDIKRAFYTQLQAVTPVKTIFASNSSTMVSRLLSSAKIGGVGVAPESAIWRETATWHEIEFDFGRSH
jgi:3-hydroxybutyryl-CoA dehydrogenase